MLSLVETLIGFSVVMLLLSLLVKSLTSVVKNHVDYYSENLRAEVDRFLSGTIGRSTQDLTGMREIQWKRVTEEFLTKENMVWWLNQARIKAVKLKEIQDGIEKRLEIHRKNLQFAFAKRTSYIALAMGLALCLFMNINAFTIWDTLYRDQGVRAKLASPESVKAAQDLKKEVENKLEQWKKQGTETETPEESKGDLQKQLDELNKQLAHFRGAVDFGMGRVWTDPPDKVEKKVEGKATNQTLSADGAKEKKGWPWGFLLYEFFGSLLTGVLVSIGAPYWHDLLKNLISLRALLPARTTQNSSGTGSSSGGQAGSQGGNP